MNASIYMIYKTRGKELVFLLFSGIFMVVHFKVMCSEVSEVLFQYVMLYKEEKKNATPFWIHTTKTLLIDFLYKITAHLTPFSRL